VKPTGWFENLRTAALYATRTNLAGVGKPVDRSEWGMTPPTVNAYYSAANNEIVFPAGRLQPPFFHPSYDLGANYGGIGATIGSREWCSSMRLTRISIQCGAGTPIFVVLNRRARFPRPSHRRTAVGKDGQRERAAICSPTRAARPFAADRSCALRNRTCRFRCLLFVAPVERNL